VADVSLIAQAVTTAPEGYTVPGAQEIILKSVFAQYDGTGAGGSYVPTLQILAPNNAVVASCPIGTTLTAGASADVTWFPRGGLSSSGGGGSGITEIDSPFGTIGITNPNGPTTSIDVEDSTSMVVSFGWQSSGSGTDLFYSQTGNFYLNAIGTQRNVTTTVVQETLIGMPLVFVATNTDAVDFHYVQSITGVIQDLNSSTRQRVSNPAFQNVPASSTVQLSIDGTGHLGALLDTTTNPATWTASGEYAFSLSWFF
jgi:hypothetical protein